MSRRECDVTAGNSAPAAGAVRLYSYAIAGAGAIPIAVVQLQSFVISVASKQAD